MNTTTTEKTGLVSIGVKVPGPFRDALEFFASREQMSTANFIRTGIMRRAAGAVKEKAGEMEDAQKSARLMTEALDADTWEKVAAKEPELFPATREEWLSLIDTTEKKAAAALDELREMDAKLKILGVNMLY